MVPLFMLLLEFYLHTLQFDYCYRWSYYVDVTQVYLLYLLFYCWSYVHIYIYILHYLWLSLIFLPSSVTYYYSIGLDGAANMI